MGTEVTDSKPMANGDVAIPLSMARTDGRTNERVSHLPETSSVPDRAREEHDLIALQFGNALAGVQPGRVGTLAPVNNREPRLKTASKVFRWLMARDGGMCWICGTKAARPVVEHVRPRSTYAADVVWLADITWNLRIACWSCNGTKGRRLYEGSPALPIAGVCTRCWHYEPTIWDEAEANYRQLDTFCRRCSMAGISYIATGIYLIDGTLIEWRGADSRAIEEAA